jgi:hypothetical protein
MKFIFIILLTIPKDTTIHIYSRSVYQSGKTDTIIRAGEKRDTILFHHYAKKIK